jgi:hypothetical protein
MRSRSFMILLLIVTVMHASFSQDSSKIGFSPRHIFTVSTGISLHAVRDEMMSPLLYRGTQAPLAISYRFRGTENRHTALFYFDNTGLNSSITQRSNDVAVSHYIKNFHLTFEYSYSTRAAVFDDLNTMVFLGARLSSLLNLRNHYFLPDNNHMSAEQMTGLDIYLLTETSFQSASHNFLSIEISIPCISYALLNSRYNANVSEDFDDLDFQQSLLWQLVKTGGVVSFNRLFGVQAEASYMVFVTNHIGFDVRYRMKYYSFAQFEDLFHARVLNNQLLIGLTVTL